MFGFDVAQRDPIEDALHPRVVGRERPAADAAVYRRPGEPGPIGDGAGECADGVMDQLIARGRVLHLEHARHVGPAAVLHRLELRRDLRERQVVVAELVEACPETVELHDAVARDAGKCEHHREEAEEDLGGHRELQRPCPPFT